MIGWTPTLTECGSGSALAQALLPDPKLLIFDSPPKVSIPRNFRYAESNSQIEP